MTAKPIVLITGAANGIGRATAIALAKTGAPLGLVDRDAEPLTELAQMLRDHGASVSEAAVDVTDRVGLLQGVAKIASNRPSWPPSRPALLLAVWAIAGLSRAAITISAATTKVCAIEVKMERI